MSEPLTLESLEKRVAALEALQKPDSQGIIPARRPWQSVIGSYSKMDSETKAFLEAWDAECKALRDADRLKSARRSDESSEEAA